MTAGQAKDDAALLNALLDATISDAIVVADADGIILRIIPTTVRMFGHSAAAMVGHSINMLMPAPDRDRHDSYIRRFLDTGVPRVFGKGREVTGLRADGTEIPLYVSLGTAKLHGAPIFVAILHDLTERRKRDHALARARRMEAISQLTGGFGHDFNNLLTIAMGNLELLEPKLADPGQREMLQDALSALELGAELTARLLAFARQSALAPERIDPNAAVRRTVQLLRRTIGRRVNLRFVPGADMPAILADPVQLQAALLNLAVNAQDAMPEGGALVFETRALNVDDRFMAEEIGIEPGCYACILVSDTGIGMDREAVRQAFEPFFTTKTGGKGTGLGLSMVDGFMGQSKGQAIIESTPGKGTVVSLYFPAFADASAITPAPPGLDAPQGAGQTILVVEDEEALRRLTAARLVALGYRPLTVGNAAEALQLIKAGTAPALVLSDVVMPGAMDGYDLAHHLATVIPGVPVLLTSGFARQLVDPPDGDRRFRFLRKPCSQSELAVVLQDMIAQTPGRTTSAANM